MIRFAQPWLLLLLLVNLPVIWLLLRKSNRALRLPSTGILAKAAPISLRVRLARYRQALKPLALTLMLLALARPQTLSHVEQVKTDVVDIMVTLDTSLSMGARDFDGEARLEVAKKMISRFLSARQADRLGLITFAAYSQLRCPLTLDHEVLKEILAKVELVDRTDLEANGTAIGLALTSSVDHLRSDARSRVVVLLTDGDNNVTTVEPQTAAEVARAKGVKVYTIGVGGRGLVEMPSTNPSDPDGTYRMQPAGFNEDVLRQIASTTSGKYFSASDAEALERVFAEIDRLERSPIEVKRYEHYRERYLPLLAAAMFLLLLDALLEHTYLRVLP